MMRVALGIDGIDAFHDPVAGNWQLVAGGDAFAVRRWTWGQRRRMVAAASLSGRLDGDGFCAGLVEALVTPVPPAELTQLFALAVLRLHGVPENAEVVPLTEAEGRLAERFGWRPSEIANEAATEIDGLLAGQVSKYRPSPGDGWTSIRFDEGIP